MLDWIAEQRIRDAIERGDFDRLPDAGRPLDLEDDPLLPDDLRLAYRILRNAGYVPPEVDALREIADLERLIDHTTGSAARSRASARLSMLRARLDTRPGAGRLDDPRYAERLAARFERDASATTRDRNERC